MSLLKQMVKEMAAAGATGAHAVATTPGSLFGGGVVDADKSKKKGKKRNRNITMIRRVTNMTEGTIIYDSCITETEVAFKDVKRGFKFKKKNNPDLVLTKTGTNKYRKNLTRPQGGAVNFKIDPEEMVVVENLGANSGESDFDSSDVISKLDDAEKRAKAGDDTTAFGMEDEDGNLVKVYVKTDSAEDFEKALSSMLAGEDENEDEQNSALEIAEVLFKLKDKFEIVDVEWPTIEGDEEEEQEMDAEEGGDDLEGDLGAEGEGGEEGDIEGDLEGGDEEMGDEEGDMEADDSDAKSALDKVIDMMKADAEAKKAEADAKKAEANAKEAEAVARAAQAKVTQEEQILDMEAHYKDKADQEKEAKQLAKLAKYQHDKAKEAESTLSMESVKPKKEDENDKEPWRTNDEEEEDKEITSEELATLIVHHLKSN